MIVALFISCFTLNFTMYQCGVYIKVIFLFVFVDVYHVLFMILQSVLNWFKD